MTLEFDKIIGDGSGDAVTTIVYLGQGGSFKKQPEVLENQSGETKQAVTIWNLKFISITRSIE
jgi:hypothetical protein